MVHTLTKHEQCCQYPNCIAPAVSIFRVEEDFEDKQQEMRFCLYHQLIVAGGKFGCNQMNDLDYYLTGPMDTVELIESVIAAIKSVEHINQKKNV